MIIENEISLHDYQIQGNASFPETNHRIITKLGMKLKEHEGKKEGSSNGYETVLKSGLF